jgi:hypothetical protein
MYRTPHRRVRFFKQAVLDHHLGYQLLELTRLRLELLDLVAGRFACRVARQPLLAHLQEVLRPTALKILVNAFLAAQFRDAILTTQTRNHGADLFLRRVLSPRCPPNVLNPPLPNPPPLSFSSPLLARYDEPKSLSSSIPHSVQLVLTGNTIPKQSKHRPRADDQPADKTEA